MSMETTVRLLQEEPTLFQHMIDFVQDPSAWLSIISAAIAIVALFQTQSQIKLSNKQHLFDRRLTDYLIAKDIVDSYIKGFIWSQRDKKKFDAKEILFYLLTPEFFASVKNITDVVSSFKDRDIQNLFYTRLQELEKIGEEIVIVFDKENTEQLNAFFKAYCDAARSIQSYLEFQYLQENNISFSVPDDPLSKNPRAYVDKNRKDAIMWFDKLKTAYDTLEKSKVMDNLPQYLKL